jgi:predicted GNAT family acetyltransferase
MYMEFFKNSLPAIAKFHAKRSASSGEGVILGAFWDGEPCGALSAGPLEEGVHNIFHFGTVEPYRKRGVCAALLDFALSRLKSSGVSIAEAGVEISDFFHAVVDSILKKKGFEEIKTLTTVINRYTDEGIADFYDFKRNKWDKFEARLVARGYAAKSFADAGEDEIQALRDEIGVSFPERLSPFRHGASLLNEFSFIILKAGRPIAYCAMTNFENIAGVSAVSSRASSSKGSYGGAAMWALVRCLEESIESGKFKRTIFTFESDNAEMANLKDRPPTRFAGNARSVSRIYRLRLENWGETP